MVCEARENEEKEEEEEEEVRGDIYTREHANETAREEKDKERKRKGRGMRNKIRNGIKTANFSTPVLFEGTSPSPLASSSSREQS
mmetsp:Transcript_50892/g.159031  ORF Transcript_50892/g.159031 Transcript_50892/m.159031 type:complete len:85 (+) Transcript_50892:1478-1732(+)